LKRGIWTNDVGVINEYVEDLMASDPDMDESLAWAEAESSVADDLDSAKVDLRVPVGDLIVIADLGLWNGRVSGYKVIPNATLADAISVCEGDIIDWYVEDGEMKIDDIHHDGVNHYVFRAWKDGVTDWRKGLTEHLVRHGITDKATLDVETRPLGADVAKVYGWEED